MLETNENIVTRWFEINIYNQRLW